MHVLDTWEGQLGGSIGSKGERESRRKGRIQEGFTMASVLSAQHGWERQEGFDMAISHILARGARQNATYSYTRGSRGSLLQNDLLLMTWSLVGSLYESNTWVASLKHQESIGPHKQWQ